MHRIQKIKLTFLVIVGLLLGITGVWNFLKHDPLFHKKIEDFFCVLFKQQFAGNFSGNFLAIEFLQPSLTFADVKVTSLDEGQWCWQSSQMHIGFSWLDLLLLGKLALKVVVKEVVSSSVIKDNNLAIFDHLKRFVINKSPIPIGLKELGIKKGFFTLLDGAQHQAFLQFHAQATLFNKLLKLQCYIHDAALFYDNRALCSHVQGSLLCSIKNMPEHPAVDVTVQAETQLPGLPPDKQQCLIRGFWKEDKGQLLLNNKDKSCALTLYDVFYDTQQGLQARCHLGLPVQLLLSVCNPSWAQQCTGNVFIAGQCRLLAQQLFGQADLTVDAITIGGHDCGTLYGTMSCENNQITMKSCFAKDAMQINATGLFCLDRKCATVQLTNKTKVSLEPMMHNWLLQPEDMHACFSYQQGIMGSMHIKATHQRIDQSQTISADIASDHGLLYIRGAWDDERFCLTLNPAVKPYLHYFDYWTAQQQRLVHVQFDKERPASFTAALDYLVLHRLANKFLALKIPGQGTMKINGDCTQAGLQASLAMPKAHIVVPGMVNPIKHIAAQIMVDPDAKKMTLDNGILQFDKGSLLCCHGAVFLDDNYAIRSLHMPVVIKKLFCGNAKRFFALANGMITLAYADQKPQCKGFIFIDRSQLKQNIFSGDVQQSMFRSALNMSSYDCLLAIDVQTKEPLVVKTPLLETAGSIHMTVGGSVRNPQLSGTIDLCGGTLAFPYRPLHIVSGKIIVLPFHEPYIEFTARGKIRKYHITMHCHGSLHAPNIYFEAAPVLSEEQIITLLVAGSEEGVLSGIVPSLALHQLQTMIFSSPDHDSAFGRYFKTVLAPFRHIRFIPRFADQTARGGFRGLIEIDVSNQLRAMIQKNFSLTEDTKIEVEYYVNDDITVRAIRDERGDFGAEIEMRLKF